MTNGIHQESGVHLPQNRQGHHPQWPDVTASRLLTVGSAFVDAESGRIKGQFRAVPPQWDGEFLILDPLPKRDEQPDEDVTS